MGKVLGIDEGTISAGLSIQKRDKIFVAQKEFSISYTVLADNLNEDEDSILSSSGIPPLWSYYRGAWCNNLAPKEKKTIFRHPTLGVKTVLWTVTASFTSNLDPDDEEEPEAKTPSVRWSGETEEEVMDKDPITDEPIQTAADEPILITTPQRPPDPGDLPL